MRSEQITVTNTPTTIAALIATARSDDGSVPDPCVGIMLRYSSSETATITLADDDSVAGAIILDASEAVNSVSFRQFDITKALLSTSAGSVTVHLIIEQTL